jgi:septum formation protein
MYCILASASPRRKALLEQIGIDVAVAAGGFAEYPANAFSPRELVRANAKGKASGPCAPDVPVIGADTVVVLGSRTLGKPADEEDAFHMLSLLSGRTHKVLTGVCVFYRGKAWEAVEETKVTLRRLSVAEIRAYIETGEPLDKAGAYGIQGLGAVLVRRLAGCYFNVMGLPLARLAVLFQKAGIDFAYKKTAAR